MANKHSVGIFSVALTAGVVACGGLRRLWNEWVLGGVALLAVAFMVPDLWWQAGHRWATIAMTQSLNAENGGAATSPTGSAVS